MSKSEVVKARGDGKYIYNISRLFAQRNGKTQEAALYNVYDEMSVYPPASKQEVEAFLRLHIKRCNVNLANAKDRGDNRAKVNLERKLACYEYLSMVIAERQEANQSTKATRECPYCRVHAVDIFGYCHCCGKSTVGGKNNG